MEGGCERANNLEEEHMSRLLQLDLLLDDLDPRASRALPEHRDPPISLSFTEPKAAQGTKVSQPLPQAPIDDEPERWLG